MARIIITMVVCLLTASNTYAYDCIVDNLCYNVNTDTRVAELTEYASNNESNGNYYKKLFPDGSVVVPEKITYKGKKYTVEVISSAFHDWSALKSVSLPNTLKSVKGAAFSRTGIRQIDIPRSVTYLSGLSGTKIRTIELSDNIETIGVSAFYNCVALREITIPNSVNTIEDGAFERCSALSRIEIPNSVKDLGKYTFRDCTALTEVKIGIGVETIGEYTFNNCSLHQITIPANVTCIENHAFDATTLTDVRIEDSEDELYFDYCGWTSTGTIFGNSPLINVYIGRRLSYPNRNNPFMKNTTLSELEFNGMTTEINEYGYHYCTGLDKVTIGDCVEKIGEYAFNYCSNMTELTIGKGLKSIGQYAFNQCESMQDITVLAHTPPVCDVYALNKIDRKNCKLVVPKGSVQLYKSAPQWREFFNISEYDAVEDITVDFTNEAYDVYNLQGAKIANCKTESELAESLPRGIYILVSPTCRKKVKL